MTRKTTWSNDSLVKGFGPNYPEREASGVHKRVGSVEEAVLHFTHESTFGEAATYIQLPRNVLLVGGELVVDVLWTSSDASLSIGHDEADTADVDALMTITEGDHGATKLGAAAGNVVTLNGTYFLDTASLKLPAVLTDSYDDATIGAKVFITSTEGVAWTTGEATLRLRYTKVGY